LSSVPKSKKPPDSSSGGFAFFAGSAPLQTAPGSDWIWPGGLFGAWAAPEGLIQRVLNQAAARALT
jgi:hypothetical protein